METKDYLKYVTEEIHSVIMATVDEEGHPVTCAIDIMDYDEGGLYFLTAKGKKFYERLKHNVYIAFTAMKGKDTLTSLAISLQGKAREIGRERLDDLFYKNPYMEDIYPTVSSRNALTVFQIYEGEGEWFDLSKHPIERASFSFGDIRKETGGYFIRDACTGCGRCITVCPQNCIVIMGKHAVIQQEHCLHCGNCFDICPSKAIERR